MRGADFVKLNREELAVLTRIPTGDDDELEPAATQLLEDYEIRQVVVTLGEAGALSVGKEGTQRTAAPVVSKVKDTVGAGDAASAVLALGLTYGWPLADTLERAVAFAADLCKVRGATPRDPALYEAHRHRWNDVV